MEGVVQMEDIVKSRDDGGGHFKWTGGAEGGHYKREG